MNDPLVEFYEGEEGSFDPHPVRVLTITGEEAAKLIRFVFLREGGIWNYSNNAQVEYRARTGKALVSRQRIGALVPRATGDDGTVVGWNVYTEPD